MIEAGAVVVFVVVWAWVAIDRARVHVDCRHCLADDGFCTRCGNRWR